MTCVKMTECQHTMNIFRIQFIFQQASCTTLSPLDETQTTVPRSRLANDKRELAACLTNRNKYLLREMAGTLRRIEYFVVEDREVQGETQAYGVRRSQVHQSDVLSTLTSAIR
jgi:hypothetical protein